MRQKRAGRPSSSEHIIKDIKRKTRKQYNAEEKVRIVLDGLCGEDSIAEKRARGWGGPYMRYTARTPRLFRLLPAGTTVARWASHPLRERAFQGALVNLG